MKWTTAVMGSVWGLGVMSGAMAAGTELVAVRAATAPVIDGKLSDGVWKTALRMEGFKRMDSEIPEPGTVAYLLYDENALYVGFRCAVPPGKSIKAASRPRDNADIPRDECVEVMIDPNRSVDRYFHFVVNAAGSVYDAYRDQGGFAGDGKFDSTLRARTFRGEGFWSAELRIPYSTLDIDPDGKAEWGFNFVRGARDPYQDSATAAGGTFHVAANFLPVSGIALDLTRFGWELAPPAVTVGEHNRELRLGIAQPVSNLARQRQQAKLDLTLAGASGVYSQTVPMELAGKSTAPVRFPEFAVAAPGEYSATVSVLDPRTRQVLKRRTYRVKVEFSPFAVQLRQPSYRNAIFASQKLQETVYRVTANLGADKLKNARITTGIREAGSGRVIVSQAVTALPETFRFPVAALPEGKLAVFVNAETADGKKIGESTAPLRKLAPRRGEVWQDDDGFWRVDGERFFMIAEWNDRHTPGVNVSNLVVPGVRQLDFSLAVSSFPAKYAQFLPVVPPEAEKIIREQVRRRRDNPELFAWFLSDEPEISGISVSGLAQTAEIIRDEDPYHPIIIANDTVIGTRDFIRSGEINGLHPYPAVDIGTPRSNFDRIVSFMEQVGAYHKLSFAEQSIAYLQQGFNYGDCGAANARVPSYDEIRTQFLLTLAMGGKGTFFYNRNTLNYPELYLGMPEMARELTLLAPALLRNEIPVAAAAVADNPNVALTVRQLDGEWWIIAGSKIKTPQTVHFSLPGLGDRRLQVLREDRTLTPVDGRFSDRFSGYDARVYTTDRRNFNLRSMAAVEQEIDRVYAGRAKPGNLLFQRYERERLDIAASSNKNMLRRAENGLWHLTDGVVIERLEPTDRVLLFSDNTPDVFPDWIELNLKNPATAGRLVLYAYQNGLRDYRFEAWVNGAWRTLASGRGATENRLEHRFAPVTAQRFRLVSEGSGQVYTQLSEIELYEPEPVR